MAKIGRNDKCPCQSGKKYKHCCARKVSPSRAGAAAGQAPSASITLMDGVAAIQDKAVRYEAAVREIGVFLFYSTTAGDAWLLEMTDCDCVQLAQQGTRLEPAIDENSETIEVNWSHQFKIVNKQLEFTAYLDKSVLIPEGAPAQAANAMLRRIRRRFSPEQLQRVHVRSAEERVVE
ncbi:MAG: SEC-C metal-binding domain-containing protein [Desulfopila sp.]